MHISDMQLILAIFWPIYIFSIDYKLLISRFIDIVINYLIVHVNLKLIFKNLNSLITLLNIKNALTNMKYYKKSN